MNFRKISLALLGLVAGAGVSSASAATFLDSSLTNPPGVYFGAGNSGNNAHFTVDRTGPVETGLSAINRFIGPVTPDAGTNDYTVSTGKSTFDSRSVWGFVFSVNLSTDGSTTYNINNTTTTLSLVDVNNATLGSFNVELIGDNSKMGTPVTAFQNSETLSFASIAAALGDPGFNMYLADTYTFTLTTTRDSDSQVLSSTSIDVNAVPEPLTLSLFAAGLVGAGALRRRKKVQA